MKKPAKKPKRKPRVCPFCGSDKISIRSICDEEYPGDAKAVYCASCLTMGPLGKTPERAVALWNSLGGRNFERKPRVVWRGWGVVFLDGSILGYKDRTEINRVRVTDTKLVRLAATEVKP